MRYLTFALAKGRLANKSLDLFEKIGITCEEMKDKDTRKLIFTASFWRRPMMCQLTWNMAQLILASWEKIRFWRKEESFMRCWI